MKLQQLFFLQRMLPDRLSGSTRATPSPCRPRGMNEVLHDGVYTTHHRLFFGPHQLECVGPRPSLPSRRKGRSTGNPLSQSPFGNVVHSDWRRPDSSLFAPLLSPASSSSLFHSLSSDPRWTDGRTSIGAAGRTERVPVEEATPKTAPTDNRAEGQHSASGGDRANDPHAWSILLLFDLEITSQWTRCQIDYSTCVST